MFRVDHSGDRKSIVEASDNLISVTNILTKTETKTEYKFKPGGVAADDCIGVVLTHGSTASNADNNDDDGGKRRRITMKIVIKVGEKYDECV